MSDRGTVLLSQLAEKLRPWFAVIQRNTHATSVEYVPAQLGEFSIEVRGVDKAGTPWTTRVPFTREECFGVTYTLTPAAWSVVKRPCDHAKRVIREVLTARGVL